MKKFTFILAFVLTAFIGYSVTAQDVTKDELLKTLNNVSDLGLSNEKSSALNNYNDGFVNNVFDITNSNKSEEDKILSLKNLRDNSENELMDILGVDSYKKFKKSMKKQLKPLKRRAKLFKFII